MEDTVFTYQQGLGHAHSYQEIPLSQGLDIFVVWGNLWYSLVKGRSVCVCDDHIMEELSLSEASKSRPLADALRRRRMLVIAGEIGKCCRGLGRAIAPWCKATQRRLLVPLREWRCQAYS